MFKLNHEISCLTMNYFIPSLPKWADTVDITAIPILATCLITTRAETFTKLPGPGPRGPQSPWTAGFETFVQEIDLIFSKFRLVRENMQI